MVFTSTATVDVVAFSFSITLVLLRCTLRPIGLLARCMSVSMISSSSGDVPTRTIIIVGKDQVCMGMQVFIAYVDSFVLPVDLIDNGVLQTCSKEFG